MKCLRNYLLAFCQHKTTSSPPTRSKNGEQKPIDIMKEPTASSQCFTKPLQRILYTAVNNIEYE